MKRRYQKKYFASKTPKHKIPINLFSWNSFFVGFTHPRFTLPNPVREGIRSYFGVLLAFLKF